MSGIDTAVCVPVPGTVMEKKNKKKILFKKINHTITLSISSNKRKNFTTINTPIIITPTQTTPTTNCNNFTTVAHSNTWLHDVVERTITPTRFTLAPHISVFLT
jgi:hypothetical protein